MSAMPAAPIARCPRLDALAAERLPGGLRLAHARRWAERARGLARLTALPPDYALQIPRCRQVHTFTMRFPLDLIWLAADGTVVRVDRAVPRNRVRTCLRARAVVEANAGAADDFLAALRARQSSSRPSSAGGCPS